MSITLTVHWFQNSKKIIGAIIAAFVLTLQPLTSALPTVFAETISDHVVINEIYLAEDNSTWIELYNPTSSDIATLDWGLGTTTGGRVQNISGGPMTFPAKTFYTVSVQDFAYFGVNGGTMTLLDGLNGRIDTVPYPAMSAANSYARITDAADQFEMRSGAAITRNTSNNLSVPSPSAELSIPTIDSPQETNTVNDFTMAIRNVENAATINARIKTTFTTGNPTDITFDYYDPALPNEGYGSLERDGNTFYYGDSTGFSLQNSSPQFQLIFSKPGTYTATSQLINAVDGTTIGAPTTYTIDVADPVVAAGTRYVSENGNDVGNTCTVKAFACKTIQHAVDNAVAGDHIVVATGTYDGDVTITKPVQLSGYTTSYNAYIEGQITILSNDVSIEGFVIANLNTDGNTPVRSVYIHGGSAGIHNINIEDNLFIIDYPTTAAASAIMVDGVITHVSITDNSFMRFSPPSTNHYDLIVGTSGSSATDASEIIFHDNQLSGIVANKDTTHTLNASNNWWGDNGPEKSQYNGAVTVDPWCFDETCSTVATYKPFTLDLARPGVSKPLERDVIFLESSANGNVRAVLSAGTTVKSNNTSWNGVIAAPTQSHYRVPGAKQTSLAISIGSSKDSLTFDQPVALLLIGQAGKSVGFKTPTGTFHQITPVCKGIDLYYATIELEPSVKECQVSVGTILYVVTSHFTTFATYTKTKATSTPHHNDDTTETTPTSITSSDSSATTPTSTNKTTDDADDKNTPSPLTTTPDTSGATSDDDTSTDKTTSSAPNSNGSHWKLAGIAWYWYVLALIVLGCISWYIAKRRNNRHEDF